MGEFIFVGTTIEITKFAINKFMDKVDPEKMGDCIVWGGRIGKSGYGFFYYAGKKILAHRFAFAMINKYWPKHTLDHLCRNKRCINTVHLEDITAKEHGKRTMQRLQQVQRKFLTEHFFL